MGINILLGIKLNKKNNRCRLKLKLIYYKNQTNFSKFTTLKNSLRLKKKMKRKTVHYTQKMYV